MLLNFYHTHPLPKFQNPQLQQVKNMYHIFLTQNKKTEDFSVF
ncbi:hypothetical protein BCB4264_A1622 [Bacillus cereus B4264]|uniref:Uncharacterized protein n=1 Tax=Bacillus cereus (strain B4264) TaxID=405532 RepID=B7HHW9_BACC4|nr:hypothetical protein BCB4264_A1622 [Bacillus cereus B4264]